MKIPKGMTESEVVDIIDEVAESLKYKFQFGYYEPGDIKQECYILSLEALEKYDNSKPLKPFLWTHLRNRLCNLKRKKYERINKPCLKCPFNAYCPSNDDGTKEGLNNSCLQYDTVEECKWYTNWANKNTTRKNIVNAISIDGVKDENEPNMKDFSNFELDIQNKEIFEIIDKNLTDVNLRRDWLKIRDGVKINKGRLDKVINAIENILKNFGEDLYG